MFSHSAPLPRHAEILALLRKSGHCSVEQLCSQFGVSEMTIRRDLQSLEAAGRVLRTHGGAVLAERVAFEFSFMQRVRVNRAAKKAIAAEAFAQLGAAKTVVIDSGTTTLALAELLQPQEGLTVITTSLPIASALQFSKGVDVMLLGGLLRQDAPDLTGPLTESNLETLHADLAFVGADAIDARGFGYNQSLPLARMLRKMTAAADRFFVVADSSKLGQKALGRFVDLRHAAGLITDAGITPSRQRALKAAGVNVIIARETSRGQNAKT